MNSIHEFWTAFKQYPFIKVDSKQVVCICPCIVGAQRSTPGIFNVQIYLSAPLPLFNYLGPVHEPVADPGFPRPGAPTSEFRALFTKPPDCLPLYRMVYGVVHASGSHSHQWDIFQWNSGIVPGKARKL